MKQRNANAFGYQGSRLTLWPESKNVEDEIQTMFMLM
jgi:hypothetical protein